MRGAMNLSFPDITVESLQRLFPDRGTRILIYCNNKRLVEPVDVYRAVRLRLPHVYELGPTVDPRQSQLEFEPR